MSEWHHLDPEKDKVLGISTFKAYELLKDRKSNTVVVAVIDNGAELAHEDLQGQFWTNPNEIEGNGIDDDKNGYIDDIHGWNFLGNQKGENIKRETTELTRIYARLNKKYGDNSDSIYFLKDSMNYADYMRIKQLFLNSVETKTNEIKVYKNLLRNFQLADSIMKEYFQQDNYEQLDLFQLKDTAKLILSARNFLIDVYAAELSSQKLQTIIKNNQDDLETRLNPDFNIRQEIIGDNPADLNDSVYGNNMVGAQNPYHGTGVAGTIAALWNDKGINGIAKDVKLMILRVLPNGDERDKDVALAIRYAVRNHADIINCSFGKSYSQNPEFVMEAVLEAENAGVLMVHAAGNDGRNSDSILTYPTGFYTDGQRAENWLSVGASGSGDHKGLVAYFSNYGEKSVDVFAPGVDVPTCIPGNKYELSSGTSTSAPVVSGIAAVLKSYFPGLSAIDMRQIIMESVYVPKTLLVQLPGNRNKLADFKNLSVSGGIVNLYQAIILTMIKYKK